MDDWVVRELAVAEQIGDVETYRDPNLAPVLMKVSDGIHGILHSLIRHDLGNSPV